MHFCDLSQKLISLWEYSVATRHGKFFRITHTPLLSRSNTPSFLNI